MKNDCELDTSTKCDYAATSTPGGYVCGSCGTSGVKLWRKYQTVLDAQSLFCGPCAVKDQKREGTIDADGKVHDSDVGFPCDQIGWLVPAVPTEENDTFWGYTSVPQAGVDWWKRLPVRIEQSG